MGEVVNARILYWGIEGAGKRTNLRMIHSRLRADHRGELENHPSRIDPSVAHTELPIELGELGGLRTCLRLVAPPSGEEQRPTRRQLLDGAAGVVFVVDTQREAIDANLGSWQELRDLLAEYGRSLDEVPIVIQYNKRDLSDPFALEELHRKLDLRGAAAFEAVASEGTGVLQTLTTISKRVVRALREVQPTREPEPNVLPEVEPRPDPAPTEGLPPELLAPDEGAMEESAALSGAAEAAFEDSFQEMIDGEPLPLTPQPWGDAGVAAPERHGPTIEQVGSARIDGTDTVVIPLVLRDERGGLSSLTLSLRLGPADDAGS